MDCMAAAHCQDKERQAKPPPEPHQPRVKRLTTTFSIALGCHADAKCCLKKDAILSNGMNSARS